MRRRSRVHGRNRRIGFRSVRPLTPLRQKSGKMVLCWLVEADIDLGRFSNNLMTLETPTVSGRMGRFAECDRATYMPADLAMRKILPGQRGFVAQALNQLGAG